MTGGVSCSLWKGGITMISEEEKLAVVKMFCAYCRRTLRNARTDIIRKQALEGAPRAEGAFRGGDWR